jgi:hypothetical protein
VKAWLAILYFHDTGLAARLLGIADRAGTLLPIEVESGMTVASDWFDGLAKWRRLAGKRAARPVLVYGGEARQSREIAEVLPWADIGELTG